jgi:diguanylate cyclase (GGDEF)-like protein/PAS domain S-box-containing protein
MRDEMIGTSANIVKSDARRDAIKEKIARGETLMPVEASITRKNGEPVKVLATVSAMKDAQGRVVGAASILHDLTELKQGEEARLRLASIVESATLAIVSKDLTGVILSWNAGAERLYGYVAAEAIGRNISLIAPLDRPDEMPQILERLARGERIEHFETQRRRKDGAVIDVAVNVAPVLDANGVIRGASAITRDITDRKRAEAEVRRLGIELRQQVDRLHSIFERALDAVVTMDSSGKITDWNAAAEVLFGWSHDEAVGQLLSDTIVPDRFRDAHRRGLARYILTGDGPVLGKRLELEARHRDGHVFPIELSIAPSHAGGKAVFSGFLRDLSPRKQAEAALRASEERYRNIVETAFEGIWIIDAADRTTFVNARLAAMLGYDPQEMTGKAVSEFMDAEARASFAANAERRKNVLQTPHEVRFLRKGGSELVTLLEARTIVNDAGGYAGSLAMISDITDRRRAEQALQAQTTLYEALVKAQDDLGQIIVLTDGDRPIYVNETLTRLTGYSAEELAGMKSISDLIPKTAESQRLLTVFGPEGPARTFEVVIVAKDGRRIDIEGSFTQFESGGRRLALTLARDITERKEAQRALQHQSMHDALTGLPNRVHLTQRLEETIEKGRSRGASISLLVLGLDHFKEVNETFGHSAGNRVLAEVGNRLRRFASDVELVARLGGDEFAALLAVDASTARIRASEVQQVLDKPIVLDGQPIDVSASIGIATFPRDADTAEVLLQRADIALEQAKQSPGSFASYAADHERRGANRLALMAELRTAIGTDQLRLVYQPLVRLADGSLSAVEALIRWDHPERGLVPPSDFVPFAERTRLIQPLTRWVLRTALGQAAAWRAAGQRIPVNVNISMRDLVDPDFPDAVLKALRDAGVEPGLLRLEITEGVIMVDPELAIETLARLRHIGIGLSVDDFGTGYSSLAYLHRLPIDELKIDHSFVMKITSTSTGASIVRASVDLGHSLRLETVAEGVEDQPTWNLLAAIGCDNAQGYFISKPLAPADLLPWLGRWQVSRRERAS